MQRTTQRLALVLAAGIALANAGFGACSGFDAAGTAADGAFPGSPSDMGVMGFPSADAAGPGTSDLGTGNRARLQSPDPLSSNNGTSTTFEFLLGLTGGTPDQVQPLVSITPRKTGSPVVGAFTWKQIGPGQFSLDLLPTGITDRTDYVVQVGDPAGGRDLVHTGVSIGTHPRVRHVDLVSENMAQFVYFVVTFSELMDSSAFQGTVSVTAGTQTPPTAVPGKLGLPSPLQPGLTYRFDLDSGKGLAQPITLHIKQTATASGGMPLDPKAWDSATVDGNGAFFVDFTATDLETRLGTVTYSWDPVVN
jgi:hypothetical protein